MTEQHPAYGRARQVTPFASVVLENNPGTMTLDGTNTWILRAPGASTCVIVDPGYRDPDHLERVAGLGPAELILLTHHHGDHSEGAEWLADRLDVPVLAFDPELCTGTGLADGQVLLAGGLELRVEHTPGHTADSVCVHLEHGGVRATLTGDTVLGRGTTVLAQDGGLGDYLRSMRGLIEVPPGTVGLPGHGPELADLRSTARYYLDHREQRLEQVRAALRELGSGASARQVVEHVYADVDPALWGAAEWSVRAQLDYLAEHG